MDSFCIALIFVWNVVCFVFCTLWDREFLLWKIRVAFPKEIQLPNPKQNNYKAHAGSFRVSTIHRTLTWTSGSLTCVPDHSYACVYTRGLGMSTSQHNIFDSEKLSQVCLVLLTQTGFEPRVFGSRARRSTHWATPSPWCLLGGWYCNNRNGLFGCLLFHGV